MLLQKYETLLQNLNSQITNGDFDFEKNKEKLDRIIEVYKLLKSKNYNKAKIFINELGFEEQKESYSQTRDWNITDNNEDNIEALNSIEMMSAIFLQNLKDKIGTQK